MDKHRDFIEQNKVIFYIIFAILFSYVIYNLSDVLDVAGQFLGLFKPLFIAIVIAFIANIPMRHFEIWLAKLQKKIGKTHFSKGTLRALAITITFLLALLIVIIFSSIVVPRIAESIYLIMNNLDSYITRLTNFINKWATKFHTNYRISRSEVSRLFTTANISGVLSTLLGWFSNDSSNVSTVVNSVGSTFVTAITAFFMSLYLLSNKERHIAQLRKLVLYIFGKDLSIKLFQNSGEANRYFNSFISGQVLEAAIFMLETYVVMRIFAFPFPELIASAAFIFAFIPMFGGFFTFVIGIVLTAAAKSSSTILFAIIFICLQQFEGNFVYPKIVGRSVGISGLFVLLGLTVFGGLFGFIGVLLAVPLTALVYAWVARFVNSRLKERKIKIKNNKVYENETVIYDPEDDKNKKMISETKNQA